GDRVLGQGDLGRPTVLRSRDRGRGRALRAAGGAARTGRRAGDEGQRGDGEGGATHRPVSRASRSGWRVHHSFPSFPGPWVVAEVVASSAGRRGATGRPGRGEPTSAVGTGRSGASACVWTGKCAWALTSSAGTR